VFTGVRNLSCVVGIIAAAVALVPAAAAPSSAAPRVAVTSSSSLDAGVLRELNAIRKRYGLVPLRINASLNAAAAQHSREMAAKGYFAHESFDGSSFGARVQRYYGPAHARVWSIGENILWSSPNVDPKRALDLWMASPGHRHNILTAAWREIGVSAVHVAAAPGTYQGLEVTIITTDFGVRR
jgi:uncharacterized protein YkwD